MKPDRLLKISEVERIISMSDTWIYEQIKAGKFPRQVQLSTRCVRWKESDIAAWIAAQSPVDHPH